MSDAFIWFDLKTANMPPGSFSSPRPLLDRMELEREVRNRRSSLAALDNRPLTHVEFESKFALIIQGTTSGIDTLLDGDMRAGLGRVVVTASPHDRKPVLSARLVRRKLPTGPVTHNTVTCLMIASQNYWADTVPVGSGLPEPPAPAPIFSQKEASAAGTWWKVGGGQLPPADSSPRISWIELRVLRNFARHGKGVDAWML